jgi:hypothetical protein
LRVGGLRVWCQVLSALWYRPIDSSGNPSLYILYPTIHEVHPTPDKVHKTQHTSCQQIAKNARQPRLSTNLLVLARPRSVLCPQHNPIKLRFWLAVPCRDHSQKIKLETADTSQTLTFQILTEGQARWSCSQTENLAKTVTCCRTAPQTAAG